jgi:hypothetical protein
MWRCEKTGKSIPQKKVSSFCQKQNRKRGCIHLRPRLEQDASSVATEEMIYSAPYVKPGIRWRKNDIPRNL